MAAAATVAALISLFAIDRALARLERTEVRNEASTAYRDGMRLLSGGRPADAVGWLLRARSLDRANRDYAVGLARALMAAGRDGDAAAQLRQVLAASSNDGEANLLLARITAREGKTAEADAYYHRAIYGTWSSAAPTRTQHVRLELAQYLAGQGSAQGLLSELLILQDEARGDPALGRTVARLMVAAGSPNRAIPIYRDLLKEAPGDVALYDGIGRAELAAGDYRHATLSFINVLRRDPTFPGASDQLRLSNALAQLDPTPRTLSSAEKHRRSVRLLQAALAEVESCAAAQSTGNEGILNEARAALERKQPKAPPANEASEELLDLAERVWRIRVNHCGARSGGDATAIIFQKLSQ